MSEVPAPENARSAPPLDSPELYFNRDLSILAFNQRVLALADDQRVPLLERLRYLTIVSINLDEFFEVRMAGLLQRLNSAPAPWGRICLGPIVKSRRSRKRPMKSFPNNTDA
ncbi:hypothetical protein [Acidithiobacillus ferridurans]|uniref:hypothetical protein n=1 Tax=Acidithiobacillus ferridurans TaxID=1232575 RepID=UPI001D011A6A|nr:hypothetical protein [Acidithiobacillus ferridurans]